MVYLSLWPSRTSLALLVTFGFFFSLTTADEHAAIDTRRFGSRDETASHNESIKTLIHDYSLWLLCFASRYITYSMAFCDSPLAFSGNTHIS